MAKRARKAGGRSRTTVSGPVSGGAKRRPPTRGPVLHRPPIVGIGASAGGIEALTRLLGHMKVDTGLAFVVIQHLAPRRPSELSAVLARSTDMPVVEAASGMRPEANHVYVIPPGVEMALRDRLLVISATDRKTPHSIDLFLCSLAEEEKGRAMGVVLSGSGCDGTEGLRAIRAEGGIALVQDPASARFPAMPESAIVAGAADAVLGLEELAAELALLSRAPYLDGKDGWAAPGAADPEEERNLSEIFGLVRGVSGVDFSEYKSTTFRRRLARRMLLRHTRALTDYLELLRAEPAEVAALGRDILIHVTEFFRDQAAFDALSREVVPTILDRHAGGQPIRIWVPGCSTGEEPYSIAICLLEALGDRAEEMPIQIFATDLSGEMIERARAGLYPEAAVRGLGPERLARFFTRAEGGYRISKAVRNLCVFVRHDLTRDPPFARLDLISCRNVLIYFSAALQRRVVPLFHFCLNPGGFLLLGHAEAVAGFRGLFASVDRSSKLFVKVGTGRAAAGFPMWDPANQAGGGPGGSPAAFAAPDIQRQAENLILSRFAPPAALVDDHLEVVHLRGQTGGFLELGPGQPNLSLLKLARPGLRPILAALIEKARKDMVTIRRQGVSFSDGKRSTRCDIEVVPVTGAPGGDRHFLILFERAEEVSGKRSAVRARSGRVGTRKDELDRLREETDATRDFLQSLLDERQRMNDEMAAANEELVASNEELQSTNEELESAKEELQSANEELSTVNDELQLRNQELDQVNSDLVNLLASVDIPIVIVSGDRRVRRFTPGARALMNLIPGDVGRPLDDIKLNVVVDSLDRLLSEVLETLQMKEVEVVDRAGHWHRMQIRPYRTVDGKLDGAVISLTDIDVFKQEVGSATAARDHVSAVLRTIRVPLVVLDEGFVVRSVNPAYDVTFEVDPGASIGRPWLETCDGAWDCPELRAALADLLAGKGDMALEVEVDCPPGTARTVAVAGSVLRWGNDAPSILITPVDVTERVKLLKDAVDARAQAVRASHAKDVFLATLSHELRGPLHAIALHADLMMAGAAGDAERARRSAEAIARAGETLDQIIGDLLDVSAIIAGKISLKRKPVDLQTVIAAAVDGVRDAVARKRIDLRLEADPAVAPVLGDQTRLQQIVGNLLTNAVKFTPAGGLIIVELEQKDGHARIRVTDSGQGIAAEFLPHVFDRFAQADSSNARAHGGLGLGLAIVRDLVRLHGGSVQADSDGPGTGASFTVDLPVLGSRRRRARTEEGEEESDPSGNHFIGIPPGPQRVGDLDKIKVLLVDDDPGARDVLSEMLRFHGAEVCSLARASEVMHALAEFRPDVILCDIAMPDEDGYSLIQRIRALPPEQGGRIPAVAVTALATRSDRKRALAAGFQLHLAKPAPIATLCDALRRARASIATAAAGG